MKRILVTALAALGLSACQIPIGPGAPPIFPETPTPVPAVVQPLDLCGPVACVIDSKTGLSYDPRYVKVCPDGDVRDRRCVSADADDHRAPALAGRDDDQDAGATSATSARGDAVR